MYELITGKNDLTYGTISGNETIVFIKPGLGGSIYGYENKYLQIAENLNKKFHCTVIVSPNDKNTEFDTEMEFIKDYAAQNSIVHYQIYYFGHSNGALIGMCEAYKYTEIKRLLLINAPLCMNPHKTIEGVKHFAGEKMILVFEEKINHFILLNYFQSFQMEKYNLK